MCQAWVWCGALRDQEERESLIGEGVPSNPRAMKRSGAGQRAVAWTRTRKIRAEMGRRRKGRRGGLGEGTGKCEGQQESTGFWGLQVSEREGCGQRALRGLREGRGLSSSPVELWTGTRTSEPTFPQATHLARFRWRHRSAVMGHFHLLKTTDIRHGAPEPNFWERQRPRGRFA